MVVSSRRFESQGIQQRAAQVRRQWSSAERATRMGLPPDMPGRLREHLSGRGEVNPSGEWWNHGGIDLFPWRPVCEP
jgi:hypothetical protein